MNSTMSRYFVLLECIVAFLCVSFALAPLLAPLIAFEKDLHRFRKETEAIKDSQERFCRLSLQILKEPTMLDGWVDRNDLRITVKEDESGARLCTMRFIYDVYEREYALFVPR